MRIFVIKLQKLWGNKITKLVWFSLCNNFSKPVEQNANKSKRKLINISSTIKFWKTFRTNSNLSSSSLKTAGNCNSKPLMHKNSYLQHSNIRQQTSSQPTLPPPPPPHIERELILNANKNFCCLSKTFTRANVAINKIFLSCFRE